MTTEEWMESRDHAMPDIVAKAIKAERERAENEFEALLGIIRNAKAKERERCAGVADAFQCDSSAPCCGCSIGIAAQIRSGE